MMGFMVALCVFPGIATWLPDRLMGPGHDRSTGASDMADIEHRRAHTPGPRRRRAPPPSSMDASLGRKFDLTRRWERQHAHASSAPASSGSLAVTDEGHPPRGDARLPAEGDEGLDRARGDARSWTSLSRAAPRGRQQGRTRLKRKRPRRRRKKAAERSRVSRALRPARGSPPRRPCRGTPRSRARGNPAGPRGPPRARGRAHQPQRARTPSAASPARRGARPRRRSASICRSRSARVELCAVGLARSSPPSMGPAGSAAASARSRSSESASSSIASAAVSTALSGSDAHHHRVRCAASPRRAR